MFKKIFVGFLVILALVAGGLAIAISMQPATYAAERQTTIAAPASEVFPHVNNFRNWEAWNPWSKLDLNAVYTYGGPKEGTGAIYRWVGNSDMGEGKMTILESRPNEYVKIKLDFIKPMEDSAITEFHFKGDGNQTVVVWSMKGDHNIMSKTMCLFMSMDKMLGDEFEKGLAAIKSTVESAKK